MRDTQTRHSLPCKLLKRCGQTPALCPHLCSHWMPPVAAQRKEQFPQGNCELDKQNCRANEAENRTSVIRRYERHDWKLASDRLHETTQPAICVALAAGARRAFIHRLGIVPPIRIPDVSLTVASSGKQSQGSIPNLIQVAQLSQYQFDRPAWMDPTQFLRLIDDDTAGAPGAACAPAAHHYCGS